MTRRNPDGTAEATKQAIEAKPHPSKRIDPAANPNPQANPSAPSGNGQPEAEGLDFVRRIVEEDNRTGKWGGRVATRFPPEPNGYLHIGHAKSICLNFGIAEEYGGTCNLRYDDTNPAKEEEEYVKSIEEDVPLARASAWTDKSSGRRDYFDTMYEYAVELIKKGKAYVDDLTAEQIRQTRGTLTAPGQGEPVPQPPRRGEPRSVRAHAQGRVPRRLARCCGRRSTWPRRTSTCATR